MNIDTYLDNQINAHLANVEYDYNLIDVVSDSNFIDLIGDDKQKILNVLKANSAYFENATLDNLQQHLEFDFMTGDYCQSPYQFNSDELPEINNQINEYCEFIKGEMEW